MAQSVHFPLTYLLVPIPYLNDRVIAPAFVFLLFTGPLNWFFCLVVDGVLK